MSDTNGSSHTKHQQQQQQQQQPWQCTPHSSFGSASSRWGLFFPLSFRFRIVLCVMPFLLSYIYLMSDLSPLLSLPHDSLPAMEVFSIWEEYSGENRSLVDTTVPTEVANDDAATFAPPPPQQQQQQQQQVEEQPRISIQRKQPQNTPAPNSISNNSSSLSNAVLRSIPTQPSTLTKVKSNVTGGFMVLGMHRSGTSMLAGLLINGSGYHSGYVHEGSPENEKGYFELAHAVAQNDAFMEMQHISWDANVTRYKDEHALNETKYGTVQFQYGEVALQFLNNPHNIPWILKDPRMCITIKTWLRLLNTTPAIVFTYRHPWEVASSLKARNPAWSLARGLQLWITYNFRAIRNSRGLCRVFSSKDIILNDPFHEAQRIVNELTSVCHVPPPPRHIIRANTNEFVDPKLQHKKIQKGSNNTVIAIYNGCKIPSYISDYAEPDSADTVHERHVYLQAMKIYCDFESGAAYTDDYDWPAVELDVE
jgi:hypothetical protein